ncbi:B-cell receptor-associated protein 31 [Amphibalanus amphitrite]|uniref:Endoplasmic reticulum transmembrane protein n=1 Tax=Amphibalanus amphitrite TaxID=1232801 RepID=A0A6A4WQB9_AMPAM|nr:B-cell receptor-associated protein 31-like [Amphibalanus amphitrite]XP_043224868.1 B-cell receptor-associated protein 31-like [Amphibalanus amphitrite]XP_043224869.1 B-cell receptor-associated protein 31-like [Amphibalanus amphitrite]XP_043224870.1 B-cell receptor-associated protein 31-like [Amphibalanus amphitrite]XP_043224871.1 B-cell receptor-associated protein 31-like [Amphibalanus amphitrite]XP_043224872.1 B-cell receptor-associated protein 31-like [Amphibalanus amphitrite]XP_04322487
MSIHWTLIAGFLYAEIAAVLLLLLPFISPKRWNSFFKSGFLQALGKQSFFYFCVVITVLVLSFLDAIREMKKYSGESKSDETAHGHLDVEIQHHMRLFRAQRNFYISGFALFLFLVLRRLVTLVSLQASLEASNEAAMRQAAGATSAAEQLLQGRPDGQTPQLDALKKQLEETEQERDEALKKAEMLQCQAEATSGEYDQLLAEHEKLQRQLNVSGDKKDD